MRKKPWARPELEACKFFIQNPSEYKGRWKEFFHGKSNDIRRRLDRQRCARIL